MPGSGWNCHAVRQDARREIISIRFLKIFTELHGDRCFGDDGAVIGGIATLSGIPVTVIGQQKGKIPGENIRCNFGMASPEGYRKALRLMKQAEKFHRPIICFVDTPGLPAGSEQKNADRAERSQKISVEMSGLKVPVPQHCGSEKAEAEGHLPLPWQMKSG